MVLLNRESLAEYERNRAVQPGSAGAPAGRSLRDRLFQLGLPGLRADAGSGTLPR